MRFWARSSEQRSECRCFKTNSHLGRAFEKFDYQSECHCSKTAKKIGTRINEKADKQGTRYIIDLSCSKMRRDDAEIAIAWLLEDERLEEILLVKSGSLKRFRK